MCSVTLKAQASHVAAHCLQGCWASAVLILAFNGRNYLKKKKNDPEKTMAGRNIAFF